MGDQEKEMPNVRFGRALYQARKSRGKTQEWLAEQIGCSKSHISSVETGARPLQPVDVRTADDSLGQGGRLLRLHRELYEPRTLDWLDKFHNLQAEAELIREYQPILIPGLLQTPDYAAQVIPAGAPWFTPEEVAKRVETRIGRSTEILGPLTPHYHAVLDDLVVQRRVGSPAIMAAQCRHLVDLAVSGRVLLQLYPWGTWPHPGLNGPLALISSPYAPDVLHVESVYLGQTSDDISAVRRYGMLFARLQADARSTADSVEFLRGLIEVYDDGAWPGVAQV
ncbi:helix-turn-helix transcriptional regulator [Nocardiopsis sp. CC223A]|uniref:helix-turn-helix domain-containing protein n=1 Tax=Nocardiopsis sp. CC223A TaxID=3044051 RepID=UPI00278C3929|nr:helix-turn-helix transcriptional regulator [Nocardiopsis sp. CC223A]